MADEIFPHTDFRESIYTSGKGWFLNTNFDGTEQIEIPTESPAKGGKHGAAGGNVAVMPIDAFPQFLLGTLSTAENMGHFSRTLKFYLAVADGGKILDQASIQYLRELGKSADGVKGEKRKEVFNKIAEYLRGMKVQKTK